MLVVLMEDVLTIIRLSKGSNGTVMQVKILLPGVEQHIPKLYKRINSSSFTNYSTSFE